MFGKFALERTTGVSNVQQKLTIMTSSIAHNL